MTAIKSLTELERFVRDFAQEIKLNDIYVLDGDLGAGKTTFVQQVCKNLEIKETVNSPTFPIVNTYNGKFLINHFDLYRIEYPEELENIGFYELLSEPSVTFIEWGSKFKNEIPKNAKWIEIKVIDSNAREIRINNE